MTLLARTRSAFAAVSASSAKAIKPAFVERMDRGLVRTGYVGHLPALASYVDRIFKGANPAELPAQAP
jgi:hypothetical protein